MQISKEQAGKIVAHISWVNGMVSLHDAREIVGEALETSEEKQIDKAIDLLCNMNALAKTRWHVLIGENINRMHGVTAYLIYNEIKKMNNLMDQAASESTKFEDTYITYGDTGFDAASAYFGEAMAYEVAASRLGNCVRLWEDSVLQY